MGGLMWITGIPGQGPVRAGAAVADSTAGLYAATGILVALRERDVSGEGQWVQTSLLQAQIALCDFQAARYLIEDEVPPQNGNDHPYSTPMGVVETADGFINLAVGGDGQWRDLCTAIQRSDLAHHPDYATQPQRLAHRAEVWALLTPIFAADTSASWLERLEAVGVPAGPIYRMDEVFADPQVAHLEVAQSVPHPRLGEVKLVGQPIGLSRTPAALVAPLADKGADCEAILSDLGYDGAAIAGLRTQGVI
ncbi:MAG: formyl-CoA transferase, partial [Azorhizobium sp. 35-67-5]